jgi:aspartate racemase
MSLDFGLRPQASASGAEAVILGCTKLGMLVSQEDSEVPSIDTSIADVHAAVDLSLADN